LTLGRQRAGLQPPVDTKFRMESAASGAVQPAEREAIAARIAELGPWFHNMELGGLWTAPDHFLGNHPADKFARFAHLLTDPRGRSVLDIGCNAGFHAIELRRRGAGRVLGIDSDERYLEQARFAARTLGQPDIEFCRLSAYDVGALGERFDIVLFMGVLYHLRHPLLALDLIREHVAGDLLVVQSLQRGADQVAGLEPDYPFGETAVFDDPGYPRLHFVDRAYAGDWTNWWIPNRAAVEAMLRASGFRELARAGDVYLCCRAEVPHARWDPAALRPPSSPAI